MKKWKKGVKISQEWSQHLGQGTTLWQAAPSFPLYGRRIAILVIILEKQRRFSKKEKLFYPNASCWFSCSFSNWWPEGMEATICTENTCSPESDSHSHSLCFFLWCFFFLFRDGLFFSLRFAFFRAGWFPLSELVLSEASKSVFLRFLFFFLSWSGGKKMSRWILYDSKYITTYR